MMWKSSQALHPKVCFWSSNEEPHLEGISRIQPCFSRSIPDPFPSTLPISTPALTWPILRPASVFHLAPFSGWFPPSRAWRICRQSVEKPGLLPFPLPLTSDCLGFCIFPEPGLVHGPSQAVKACDNSFFFFLRVVLNTPFYLLTQRDGDVGPWHAYTLRMWFWQDGYQK